MSTHESIPPNTRDGGPGAARLGTPDEPTPWQALLHELGIHDDGRRYVPKTPDAAAQPPGHRGVTTHPPGNAADPRTWDEIVRDLHTPQALPDTPTASASPSRAAVDVRLTEAPFTARATRERRDPVPFGNLISATPDSPTRTELRIDPFWTQAWSQGADATWLIHKTTAAQTAAGLGEVPYYLKSDPDGAWSRIGGNGRGQELRFDALAVLDSWRTVTTEQLAQITGHPQLANPASGVAADLFQLDLADVGLLATGLTHRREARRATLLRPAHTNVLEKKVLPRLTFAERIGITGGQPVGTPGRQFARHNLMAAELSARVAEWCEIGGVVGEKLSTWQLIAGTPSRPYLGKGHLHSADATLIRTDGLRIAVEITATVNENFRRKVRSYAELLSHRRLADTGLVVLFVVIGRAHSQKVGGSMLKEAKRAISDAARDWPGVNHDRVAERMLVTSWTKLFPAPGMVNPSFPWLPAQRPTGGPSDRWHDVGVLDVLDLPFEPKDPDGAIAVLDNLAAIRSVPRWLRNIDRAPELWMVPLRAAGFDEIPVPARDDGSAQAPLGRGVGAAGPAQLPLRFRVR